MYLQVTESDMKESRRQCAHGDTSFCPIECAAMRVWPDAVSATAGREVLQVHFTDKPDLSFEMGETASVFVDVWDETNEGLPCTFELYPMVN